MGAIYPVLTKEQSRDVRLAIRRVFLDVWDPIGVRDEPFACDEYDGYIGRTFELLMSGAKDREIEEYLQWIVGRMGMDSSRASYKQVIVALRDIDLNQDIKTKTADTLISLKLAVNYMRARKV